MKNLFKALANFQQEVPVIHKGTTGFGYSYADLPAIFEVINPLLKKHGLGFTQVIMPDYLKTIVFHVETGEFIESSTNIPQGVQLSKMNEFQVLGSAITYIRRYALSSILGLVTDKDTDAAGEQVKKEVKKATVNDDVLRAMLKAISEGKKETVKAKMSNYDLTEAQLLTLNTAINGAK